MKILLAISGSISFYKCFELISLFKKEGIQVKALLSPGVMKFVNKISFDALCESVLCEDNESWENSNNHIAFSKDCDLILFAPASVNSINKLAYGICDNVFLSTLIAANKPMIIAPAANTNMYLHQSTQESLKILKSRGAVIVEPICKLLACNDKGVGALAEVQDIFKTCLKELYKDDFFIGKNILITGGGTREAIDLVRNIGNYSSGKMADSIANAAYLKGANVVYLKARCNELEMPNFKTLSFDSSKSLNDLLQNYKDFDYLIMCAAVSDFIPIQVQTKLKRADFKDEFCFKIKENDDLLAKLDFKGKKIGFKLEADKDLAFDNAKKAFKNKGLDLLCLNILGDKTQFGNDYNEIFFCTKNGIEDGIYASKNELANIILDKVKTNECL